MRNLLATIRILIIVGFAALLAEYFYGTEQSSAIVAYPQIAAFLVFLTIVLIAIEMIWAKVEDITDELLTPEQKNKLSSETWLSGLYHKLLDQKAIEQESEIILDHDYDGIKELDNNLPPWWIYLFYATIVFAFWYYIDYQFIRGNHNQKTEYETEMAFAQASIEAYRKANPDAISLDNVTLLTEAADLQEGKAVYQANCIACHAPDGGGGIGPNLVDEYWILGGGIKNVFNTITNGGREGKGMVPWKGTLSAKQIQQVASYVVSLQGTTPASPKEPQGDL